MSDVELAVLGVASLFVSAFSSLAGGGGGFITTPLMIFLGLSPAQAVANGKFAGFSIAASNIQVLRKQKLHSWSVVVPLMIIAAVVGLAAPSFIVQIEGDTYKRLIGVFILLMIPVVHFKKIGHTKKKVSERQRVLGYTIVAGLLFLQGVFSSGLGTLVNLGMSKFLGMSALESGISKRLSQLTLNAVILIGLAGSGLLIWKVIVVVSIANYIGAHVGARFAVKKGNEYVTNVLKVAMLVSGLSMLFV